MSVGVGVVVGWGGGVVGGGGGGVGGVCVCPPVGFIYMPFTLGVWGSSAL